MNPATGGSLAADKLGGVKRAAEASKVGSASNALSHPRISTSARAEPNTAQQAKRPTNLAVSELKVVKERVVVVVGRSTLNRTGMQGRGLGPNGAAPVACVRC